MAFQYANELINNALTYPGYRKLIQEMLASAPADAAAEKMRPHLKNNAVLMDDYDQSYRVSPELLETVTAGPSTTWLVITEGWCGDAAFNVPLFQVLENKTHQDGQTLWPIKEIFLVIYHQVKLAMITFSSFNAATQPRL